MQVHAEVAELNIDTPSMIQQTRRQNLTLTASKLHIKSPTLLCLSPTPTYVHVEQCVTLLLKPTFSLVVAQKQLSMMTNRQITENEQQQKVIDQLILIHTALLKHIHS